MKKKDKDNFRGEIRKCCEATSVYISGDIESRVIIPIFKISLTDKLFELIRQKTPLILTAYEQIDIFFLIAFRISRLLDYDELRNDLPNNKQCTGLAEVGKLPDLLSRSKIIDIANNTADEIIRELENPTESYALVQLPNVELHGSNIEISDDIILLGDIRAGDVGDDYFNIDDEQESFSFSLEKKKAYVLMEQMGRNWRGNFRYGEPLVYKNLTQKLKTFLGLSLIRDIFDTSNIAESKEKRRINLLMGIFSSAEWYEGFPEDSEGPIPGSDPKFEIAREMYSEGDELRRFCFQKRFFLEDEMRLPQTLVNLLDSLTVSETSTKRGFDWIKGKIIPLHRVDKVKSPAEYLREAFEPMRIVLSSIDEYAERIKAASLWYLDGFCADNDTFKFIDYTIAIESLLGPKDKRGEHKGHIPLTESLSDRCGFSLGENLKEREEIKLFFKKKIYETRCRIVHEGKTILSRDDNEILKKLETMAKQLINDAISTH